MPLRLKLQDIIEAIDLPDRDWQSYVNRETGAIVTIMADSAVGPDGEVDPEIVGAEEFLLLPGGREIDEWSIMQEFAQQRSEPQREELLDALNGRGAFRMFRTVVKRARMEDEWYRFRERAFAAIAREWLDEQGFAYE